MFFNTEFLDNLTAQAKGNPRLRQACDLRTTPDDNSQRMLNALEPGTIMPIHRHRNTSETMVMVRGALIERFYSLTPDPSPSFDKLRTGSGEGKMIPVLTQEIEMRAGGECPVVQIEAGQWHSLEVLESGTIIFEAKDGRYEQLGDEDIMKV